MFGKRTEIMTTSCSEDGYMKTVQNHSSPEKINGRLPPYNVIGSVNSSRRNLEDSLMLKQGSSKPTALKNKRKLSEDSDSDDEVSFKTKRRRIDDISQRLRGAQQNNVAAFNSISAKPAVLTIQTNCSSKRSNKSINNQDTDSKDLLGLEVDRPQHLETVQNMKNLQLSQLYSSVIKDCETSPFKGKMSAFEISLLKGKQSMERRKSLEAAALRSSPRMNSNLPKLDYTDGKRKQRTNSVPQTGTEKLRARKRSSGQRKTLRIRTRRSCKDNKYLSAVSPSSIENRCIEKTSPARKRRKKNNASIPEVELDPPPQSPPNSLYTDDRTGAGRSPGKEAFGFRMNGSPQLKAMPTVLSLNSLSGIPLKIQGSSFSSFHADLRANGISGTPSALPDQSVALISEAYNRAKSSARPETLSFNNATIPQTDQSDTSSVSPGNRIPRHSASRHNNVIQTKTKRMSLEETVSMLRKSATPSCGNTNTLPPPACISPSTSEGKVSRRSSRSTTPNISPLKSEVLTPSNTPCSTPGKSPRTSPFRVGGKSHSGSKRRRCLFVKNDDVLARWHDGLFYSGKILRIDEKNSKCLLRYEDNSEFWSMFKDIHRVAREEEMICCVCFGELSEPPDEIVLCDNCCQGYHQRCHAPHISSRQIVDPDDEWFCRECVFLMSAKVGGAIKDGKAGEELRKMKQSLPYELVSLTWDNQHKNNVEQCYCYCGGPGIWYQKMLQCCRCKQWFHEACMQCMDFPLMFGDSFYIFVCTSCNFGNEYVKRVDVEWQDLMHITLFNLVMENKRKKYFHIANDIIPWIVTNWKALQVQTYEKMSRDEKFRLTMESLQNNKSRFSCAENSKPCMLWGLRIRVPPPRIFITLPVQSEVSDDIMKKLKIKGRRSKVFIPMECKSPVMTIRHSPMHPNTSARKRLDEALSIKVEGTNSPTKTQVPANSHVCKSRVKQPLLDCLIPRQTSFSGCNHPFKTELEIEQEKNEMNKCKAIWASYQTMSSNNIDSMELEEVAGEGPPILEKVEPISPSNSNSSTPPMPEINKKNRSKKSVQSEKEQNDAGASGRRSSRRVSLKVNAPPNITESQVAKTEISVKKVKTSYGNYFCAFDKTGYGKGFYIVGQRHGESGCKEYLVDWDV